MNCFWVTFRWKSKQTFKSSRFPRLGGTKLFQRHGNLSNNYFAYAKNIGENQEICLRLNIIWLKRDTNFKTKQMWKKKAAWKDNKFFSMCTVMSLRVSTLAKTLDWTAKTSHVSWATSRSKPSFTRLRWLLESSLELFPMGIGFTKSIQPKTISRVTSLSSWGPIMATQSELVRRFEEPRKWF